MNDQVENNEQSVTSIQPTEVANNDVPQQGDTTAPSNIKNAKTTEAPATTICCFPVPSAISTPVTFTWDESKDAAVLYAELGTHLAKSGDLYRSPTYGGGLILASENPIVPTKSITNAKLLGPVILDRLRVTHLKNGKNAGRTIPSRHLATLLQSECFLQEFRPLDAVTAKPKYCSDFALAKPGYNDLGQGQWILFTGGDVEISDSMETINAFLDVMEFASPADRTNAVAAALTVMLRHFWPGAKPCLAVSSTKSHGGKETTIAFAAGTNAKESVSYQKTDWALEKHFVEAIRHSPDIAVVNIENVRLNAGQTCIASAFLERLITEPEPLLRSIANEQAAKRRNDFIVAISTNSAAFSEDLLNRSLPIRLNPVGNIQDRKSPIGNPKLEFLPRNGLRIEAELRGMIERWKQAGRPLDLNVKHAFTDWAQIVGGILLANGFRDFLANYGAAKTGEDPVRSGLALLGAAAQPLPGGAAKWRTASDWAAIAVTEGLVGKVIPDAERENDVARARGMGIVFKTHEDETFVLETDAKIMELQLQKKRARFGASEPSKRYRFEIIKSQPIPEDSVSQEKEVQQ